MSEAEVERLIDRIVEAMHDRDVGRLMTLVDPEFEFYSRLLRVDGRAYRGEEGIRRFFAEVDEAFERVHWTLDEIVRGAGDDLVVVFRQELRGRASGAPLDLPSFQAWKFRDGRPWRMVVHETRAEALEAAGLEETRGDR